MIINSTIEDITLKLQTGKTPPSKETKYFDGGVNWYTPSDLNKKLLTGSRRTITKLAYEDKKATIYPKGTVLLSCIGDVGKLGIITDDTSSSNQQITGLIPDTDKVTSEYLYYWCLAHKKVFESKSTSVTLPMLNNKRLRKIKISYDDNLDNQIKIANLLTQVESLIAKREESIKLLDELLRSTFLDMFGDPVLNSNKIKIKDFTNVETGATPSRKKEELYYLNGDNFWIKTTEVKGKYIYKTEEMITDIAIKKSNCKIFPENTIVMAMYGQGKTRGNVGYLKVPAATNQACAAILPSKEYSSVFLFYQLKYLYNHLRVLGRGGGQPNLNLTIVKNYEVISPRYKDTQNIENFEIIVQQVEETKKSYNESLDELHQLFGSLSQRAFKGELDLSGMPTIHIDYKKSLSSKQMHSDSGDNIVSLEDDIGILGLKMDLLPINISRTSEEYKRISFHNLNEAFMSFYGIENFSIKSIQHFFGQYFSYDDVIAFIYEKIRNGEIRQEFDNKTRLVKLVQTP